MTFSVNVDIGYLQVKVNEINCASEVVIHAFLKEEWHVYTAEGRRMEEKKMLVGSRGKKWQLYR